MGKKSKIDRFNLRAWRKAVATERAQGKLSATAYRVAGELAAHADEFSGCAFGAKDPYKRKGQRRPPLYEQWNMSRATLYAGKRELVSRGWLYELDLETAVTSGFLLGAMMRGEHPVDVAEALAEASGFGDDVDPFAEVWTPTDVKDAQKTWRDARTSRPLFFDPRHAENLDETDQNTDGAVQHVDGSIQGLDESVQKLDGGRPESGNTPISDKSLGDLSLGGRDAGARDDAKEDPPPPKTPKDLCPRSERLALELARRVKKEHGEELAPELTKDMVAFAVAQLPRGVRDADGFFAIKLERYDPGKGSVARAWSRWWRSDLAAGWSWGKTKRVVGVLGEVVLAPGAKPTRIIEHTPPEAPPEEPSEEVALDFERALWLMDPYRGEWTPERVAFIVAHDALEPFEGSNARRQRFALGDHLEALELAPELLEAARTFIGGAP